MPVLKRRLSSNASVNMNGNNSIPACELEPKEDKKRKSSDSGRAPIVELLFASRPRFNVGAKKEAGEKGKDSKKRGGGKGQAAATRRT